MFVSRVLIIYLIIVTSSNIHEITKMRENIKVIDKREREKNIILLLRKTITQLTFLLLNNGYLFNRKYLKKAHYMMYSKEESILFIKN